MTTHLRRGCLSVRQHFGVRPRSCRFAFQGHRAHGKVFASSMSTLRRPEFRRPLSERRICIAASWCTWTPGNVGPNGVRPRASAARPYNSRLAYVSVSRGRYDAQIYTNDAQKLGEDLSRDVSKQSALETKHEMGGPDYLLSVLRISGGLHSCLRYNRFMQVTLTSQAEQLLRDALARNPGSSAGEILEQALAGACRGRMTWR